AAFRFLQLMNRGEHEAGTTHTEWMAESDGAAVGIDVLRIFGNAELSQARHRLAGESLVQFDGVEIVESKIQANQQFFRGRHRADAHDARCDSRSGHTENASSRR